MIRLGPIGWTLALICALVTGQPLGPTLLGAAMGYAWIFGVPLLRRWNEERDYARPPKRPPLTRDDEIAMYRGALAFAERDGDHERTARIRANLARLGAPVHGASHP